MQLGFRNFELRTTDVNDAEAFYHAVLGRVIGSIVPLSSQARASGAPSHWLGILIAPSIRSSLQTFLAAGAQVISPKGDLSQTLDTVILKDPGGAVIGMAASDIHQKSDPIGFYQLLAPEAPKVLNVYRDVFGWKSWPNPKSALGPAHHMIGGYSDDVPSGMVVDTRDLPGSHPHWLYFFRVKSLTLALTEVDKLGGDVFGVYTLPSGQKVAVCHDRQGAAFGVCE